MQALLKKLKEAILQRYDITEESYRQRFRACKKKYDESNREMVAKLDYLATKWLKSAETVEQIRDKIVLEQFLSTLPEEVRVFVEERKPGTSEDAGKLADDYFQARMESRLQGHSGKLATRGTGEKKDRMATLDM